MAQILDGDGNPARGAERAFHDEEAKMFCDTLIFHADVPRPTHGSLRRKKGGSALPMPPFRKGPM